MADNVVTLTPEEASSADAANVIKVNNPDGSQFVFATAHVVFMASTSRGDRWRLTLSSGDIIGLNAKQGAYVQRAMVAFYDRTAPVPND